MRKGSDYYGWCCPGQAPAQLVLTCTRKQIEQTIRIRQEGALPPQSMCQFLSSVPVQDSLDNALHAVRCNKLLLPLVSSDHGVFITPVETPTKTATILRMSSLFASPHSISLYLSLSPNYLEPSKYYRSVVHHILSKISSQAQLLMSRQVDLLCSNWIQMPVLVQ